MNVSCRSDLNLVSLLSGLTVNHGGLETRRDGGEEICGSIKCVFIRSGPGHWQANQCLVIRLNVEWGVGGSGSGRGGGEISIKKGTAASRPEELSRQYPESGSLTKQCVLNAKLLQPQAAVAHPDGKRTPCLMEVSESLQQVEKTKTPRIRSHNETEAERGNNMHTWWNEAESCWTLLQVGNVTQDPNTSSNYVESHLHTICI